MAVDTHIIVEKYHNGTWGYHQHFSTQETKAYCAISAIYRAADTLGFIEYNIISDESFDALNGYELEKDDLTTLSLAHFLDLLNMLDPYHKNAAPEIISAIAKKYQEDEHLQCMDIIRTLSEPTQHLEPTGEYRTILFWGY